MSASLKKNRTEPADASSVAAGNLSDAIDALLRAGLKIRDAAILLNMHERQVKRLAEKRNG